MGCVSGKTELQRNFIVSPTLAVSSLGEILESSLLSADKKVQFSRSNKQLCGRDLKKKSVFCKVHFQILKLRTATTSTRKALCSEQQLMEAK